MQLREMLRYDIKIYTNYGNKMLFEIHIYNNIYLCRIFEFNVVRGVKYIVQQLYYHACRLWYSKLLNPQPTVGTQSIVR